MSKRDELSSVGEIFNRQRAGISIGASADFNNPPVVGIEHVINSTPKELITEKNQCSPEVMNELSSVDNQAKIIDVVSFRKEQERDASLKEIWDMAKIGHASYFISKNLLFY